MAANNSKGRSALGGNPLSKGIFSKTEEIEPQPAAPTEIPGSIVEIQESRFLNKGEREPVNLRLPIELNDWLNDLLKKGKRKHGSKIPKEVWVQAALELFRSMPIDWAEIDTEENLHSALFNLESRINNLD
jgi:hypothetical protein